jgi:hypothetical protein
MNIHPGALANVVAAQVRRIDAGTWSADARTGSPARAGRVSGMRSRASARATARTMSSRNGAAVGDGLTVASTPLTSGPRVNPAATATMAASAPLPACCLGCSSRIVTVVADITSPAATP